MEINKKIQNYQSFFDDQIREAEVEQKTIIKTPINQLLQKEEICIGYVDHVNIERGHVILRFFKDRGPRLKIQKSIVIIKKAAMTELGTRYSGWNCSFLDFFRNEKYHSASSELIPLYYLHRNDPKYDYVGCSSVSLSLFDFMRDQTSKGKTLTVVVYSPFPPVDYFKNLNSYMNMYPGNEELLIEPKIEYEDWHPVELAYDLNNESSIADTIMRTLEEENICILQGPPGSGKSYTIAQILKHYLNEGKTACVTTMANKGLIELVQQSPLKEILAEGKIVKTNLSADEKRIVKDIKPSANGLIVPEGELLCSTNYVLSYAFNQKNVEEYGLPSYDLIIIEEASQAYFTSIVAFKSLGKRCLIVGDPMQLPPIVTNLRKNIYRTWNVNFQIEGLKTFALGTDIKSYRITTTFRLTPESATLTGLFYDNHFTSVQKERLDYSKSNLPYFPPEGGVLYYCTDDFTNGIYSMTSLQIMSDIVDDLEKNYPKRSVCNYITI
jgi:energy-coupling factor transporter ATP-binding protein EcfA2